MDVEEDSLAAAAAAAATAAAAALAAGGSRTIDPEGSVGSEGPWIEDAGAGIREALGLDFAAVVRLIS